MTAEIKDKTRRKKPKDLRHKSIAFWSRNKLNIITTILLCCSVYFYSHVQRTRTQMLGNHPELFKTNETVTITNVIDGDELRIANEQGHSRIRLLGIKSFDPTLRDMTLSEYGKVSVDFLTNNAVGKKAQLIVSPKGTDGKGRLLGTLLVFDDAANEDVIQPPVEGAETGESPDQPKFDLAEEMARQGMTLVYTKYPFAQMDSYLRQQKRAEQEQIGLWSNNRVAAKAREMQELWTQEAEK